MGKDKPKCKYCKRKDAKKNLDHCGGRTCKSKSEAATYKSSHNINNSLYYPCGIHNRNAYAPFQHSQICDK